MQDAIVEVFRSKKAFRKQRWYFRVRDLRNGQVLAQSEAYTNKHDCTDTALRFGVPVDLDDLWVAG